jgi:hypothetical protein
MMSIIKGECCEILVVDMIMDTSVRWTPGSPGPPPIGVRYSCSQCVHDAMRWVHMHNIFLSSNDFWRYLEKAYNSVRVFMDYRLWALTTASRRYLIDEGNFCSS